MTEAVTVGTSLIAAATEAADEIENRRAQVAADRDQERLEQLRADAARVAGNVLELGVGALCEPHSWYATWADWGQTEPHPEIVYGHHDEGMLFRFRTRGDDGNYGSHFEIAVQVSPDRVRRHVEDPDCAFYPQPFLDWVRVQSLAELGAMLRSEEQPVLLAPPELPDTVEPDRILANALVGHSGWLRADIGPDDVLDDDDAGADRRWFSVSVDPRDGALLLRVRAERPSSPVTSTRAFILRGEEVTR